MRAKILRDTLENGLSLSSIEKRENESVAFHASFGRRLSLEPKEKRGLMSFCLNLWKQQLESKSFLDEIDSMGASVWMKESWERTEFGGVCLADTLGSVLSLLFTSLREPSFTDEEIEKVRAGMSDEVSERDINRLLERKLREEIYPKGYPYQSLKGSKETIEQITKEYLEDFRRQHYHPGNLTFAISGNISFPEVAEKLLSLLEGWDDEIEEFQPKEGVASVEHPPSKKESIYSLEGEQESGIAFGYKGIPVSSPHFQAVQAINTILVTLKQERLVERFRQTVGVVYDVDLVSDESLWYIRTTCKPADVEQVREVFLEEIGRLNQELISDEVLSVVRRVLPFKFFLSLETNEGVASFLHQLELSGRKVSDFQEYAQGYETLTSTQILEAARNCLPMERYILVATKPSERIV